MRLTITTDPTGQQTTIQADDALQQVITSVAAAVVALSHAAAAIALAVERETADPAEK